jgi:hypothetical protein
MRRLRLRDTLWFPLEHVSHTHRGKLEAAVRDVSFEIARHRHRGPPDGQSIIADLAAACFGRRSDKLSSTETLWTN